MADPWRDSMTVAEQGDNLPETIPPDAKLHFADKAGRPCKATEEVYLWTWEGASRWIYASQYRPWLAVEGQRADRRRAQSRERT